MLLLLLVRTTKPTQSAWRGIRQLHRVPKTFTFYFLNNFVRNQPILMIVGMFESRENLT